MEMSNLHIPKAAAEKESTAQEITGRQWFKAWVSINHADSFSPFLWWLIHYLPWNKNTLFEIRDQIIKRST